MLLKNLQKKLREKALQVMSMKIVNMAAKFAHFSSYPVSLDLQKTIARCL